MSLYLEDRLWVLGDTAVGSAKLGLTADLVFQLALQLSKLPGVFFSLLLKWRLLHLRSLPQRGQLCFLLTHRSHQTLLLCLQSRHWAVHLLRHLADKGRHKPHNSEHTSDELILGTINAQWHLPALTASHSPSRCSAGLPWFLSPQPSSPATLFSVSQFRTFVPPATATPKCHYNIDLHHGSAVKQNAWTPTFMSDSCFTRSISNDSCCLVLSTSSWVCCVADSILTVSALCRHVSAH